MSFGNFFENIQVFVAVWATIGWEQWRDKKGRNAGGFDTDIFFFLFLFILFSRWRGEARPQLEGL